MTQLLSEAPQGMRPTDDSDAEAHMKHCAAFGHRSTVTWAIDVPMSSGCKIPCAAHLASDGAQGSLVALEAAVLQPLQHVLVRPALNRTLRILGRLSALGCSCREGGWER